MRIEPSQFREQIVASATAAMMERSKRYTRDGKTKHVPMAYVSLAQHLVEVAEGTHTQMAEKTNGDAHSPLSWLCIMLGPSFEQEVVKLQRKLAPRREL